LISKIKGKISEIGPDRAFIDVDGLTYEIMLPSGLLDKFRQKADELPVELYTIYYIEGSNVGNQYPRLVGFADPVQRDFFTMLTNVSGLGVKKALRSLVLPINIIARAIESEDVRRLTDLPGIGPRMADKIIAELKGRVAKFALMRDDQPLATPARRPDFTSEVMEVLKQLQYKPAEIKMVIERALATGKHFKSSEEMLQQIFKQSEGSWRQGVGS
jgi:Holliday junction DNA helicase RuvA